MRLLVISAFAALAAAHSAAQPRVDNATLTAVPGIKVGHYTLTTRPTGCTVVLAEAGATAAVDVRGAAPATRETDLLDPVNSVQVAHAIVLAGGSAFGLDSASGVMQYLEEKRIGFAFGPAHVPIVPAAALFDLGGLDTPDLGLRLHTTGGLTGRYSTWGYSNPIYDAAARKAMAALDPAERGQLSREAQRLLLEDVPAMFPISASPEYALVAKGVSAYDFESYDYNTGFLAANWMTTRTT